MTVVDMLLIVKLG